MKTPSLTARFAETMPDAEFRPIRDNYAVKIEAARLLLPLVSDWVAKRQKDGAQTAETIMAAIEKICRWECKPEIIARLLAAKLKLKVDAELVEIFGDYDHEISRMHDLMVQCWVSQHGIRPIFAVHDKVLVTIGGGLGQIQLVEGRICAIDERRAMYQIASGNSIIQAAYERVSGRSRVHRAEGQELAV